MKKLLKKYVLKKFCTEQCVKSESSTVIPKPNPLIGGSEVYQKDNNTPYWYCKIKEGRDEFMHLYFEDLTEDDVLFDTKGKKRKYQNFVEKNFKDYALNAVNNKPTEGFCWIPVYEPSVDLKGNLQYVSGAEVFCKFSSYAWEEYFKKYSPENGSKQATITIYMLLALRWLKDGIVTFEQLVCDSEEIGHFFNYDKATKKIKKVEEYRFKDLFDLEKTGEHEFGGLYGFVGNTPKIVKDPNSTGGFAVVGTDLCNFIISPVVWVTPNINPSSIFESKVGLLQLTK